MNIQQLAEKAFDKLEPSHTRRMVAYAGSTNPEIINGRNVLADRKTRMVGIIADAITDAVAAERSLADGLANGLLHETGTGDVLPLSRAYEAWKEAREPSPENVNVDASADEKTQPKKSDV